MRTIDDFTRPLEYSGPVDEALAMVAHRIAQEDIIPQRRVFDEDWLDHKLIKPIVKKLMVDLGVQRFILPQDVGGFGAAGSGFFHVTAYRLVEILSQADSALAVSFAAGLWPLLMIVKEPHLNQELCEEFAPRFCDTTDAFISSTAMTEPQGGADIENIEIVKGSTIRTTAELDGDEWVVNGHKLWPTNSGGIADLFGVVCTTDPGSRDEDDFAFIFVPGDTPGVTQGSPYEKAGMAADKNSDIWFENVRVPKKYRACGPGDDFKFFKEVLSLGNMGSIGVPAGVMMNAYEIIKDYVSRKTYRGLPLKENDAIAGTLADFVKDIEVVRILGYQYARMLDRPDIYGDRWESETVAKGRAYKYFACDRAIENLGRMMNLMDVYGGERDLDLEKHWRDVKMVQLWMGGKQLCQMEVARWFFECETL